MGNLILITSIMLPSANPEMQKYMEFERQKLVTYDEAVKLAMKNGKPLVVWVNYSNFDDYKNVKSDVIHVFVQKFAGISQSGVVIGRKNGQDLERVKDLTHFITYSAQIDEFLTEKPKTTVSAFPVFPFNYANVCPVPGT